MKIQIQTPYIMDGRDMISYNMLPNYNLIINIGDRSKDEYGKNKEKISMCFTFYDVVGVKDRPTFSLFEFVQETENNDFMNEVLAHVYEKMPEETEETPYKRYAFYGEGNDEYPCMEIIATDVKIEKV